MLQHSHSNEDQARNTFNISLCAQIKPPEGTENEYFKPRAARQTDSSVAVLQSQHLQRHFVAKDFLSPTRLASSSISSDPHLYHQLCSFVISTSVCISTPLRNSSMGCKQQQRRVVTQKAVASNSPLVPSMESMRWWKAGDSAYCRGKTLLSRWCSLFAFANSLWLLCPSSGWFLLEDPDSNEVQPWPWETGIRQNRTNHTNIKLRVPKCVAKAPQYNNTNSRW